MSRDRFRWVIVGLLFAITIIDYVDRSVIAFAVPLIEAEWGLSAATIGFVLGALGLDYTATTRLGGRPLRRQVHAGRCGLLLGPLDQQH